MVVATHGRSFWILDDISVFHQLNLDEMNDALKVFAPKPTVRLRRNGGYGDPHRGVVNYGHAGTSITLYDPVNSADGSSVPNLLTAGANPPQGVVVQYFLPEKVDNCVTLTFKDEQGRELRRFSSDAEADPPRVPVTPGVNRFVWNLRTPGVASPAAPDLDPWDRSDGPMVLQGLYQVQLSAGGKSVSASFELLPDPRLSVSGEVLSAQRDFLLEVLESLDKANRTVDSVDSLLAQLKLWQQRTDGAEVQNSIETSRDQLRSIRSQLIDVNIRGSQLWPSGLHEKFNALLDSADGADYAPPQQARDVFAELNRRLAEIKSRLGTLEKNEIATLNRAIADQGLATVGLPV